MSPKPTAKITESESMLLYERVSRTECVWSPNQLPYTTPTSASNTTRTLELTAMEPNIESNGLKPGILESPASNPLRIRLVWLGDKRVDLSYTKWRHQLYLFGVRSIQVFVRSS